MSGKKKEKCEENEKLSRIKTKADHRVTTSKMFVVDCGKCEKATHMCKQLSVDVSLFECVMCVCCC